uniref:DNA primase large subunit n=1 Tax=Rhabditophanes sp. KR3021 TaxID=114890 RepID=A0AC35THE7_9BILA
MDFGNKNSIKKVYRKDGTKVITQETGEDKKFAFQLYKDAPTGDCDLSNLERVSYSRLKMLKKVGELGNHYANKGPDYNSKMFVLYEEFKKLMVMGSSSSNEKVTIEYNNDWISHFFLCFAFCRNEEDREWFIKQELDLFRYRFTHILAGDRQSILAGSGLEFEKMEDREKNELVDVLMDAGGLHKFDVQKNEYYKMDFLHALSLVRRRKIYLCNGIAYVNSNDIAVVLSDILRSTMDERMKKLQKKIPTLGEEERLVNIGKKIANIRVSGKAFEPSNTDDSIVPQRINEISKASFPPCMRRIQRKLVVEGHLKYGARIQYTPFLQALGMTLDNALIYFRGSFAKTTSFKDFEKKYEYSIKHVYGKEGHGRVMNPFSCSKIITSASGAGDCNGCPFQNTDKKDMDDLLDSWGLTREQSFKVKAQVTSRQYQIACTKAFEFVHGMDEQALGQTIQHPNEYFKFSQEVLTGKRSKTYYQGESMEFNVAAPATAPLLKENVEPMEVDKQ